jgi:glutathione peroxidase
MMRTMTAGTVLGLGVLLGAGWSARQPASSPPAKSAENPAYVLGFTMKTIDGKDQDLSVYKGKVVLIVNVASKCGLTPQYEGLEKLYETRKDAGLVVLGFPANEFNGQEPGTDAEIKSFCTGTYGVTFPMFSKIVVKGEGQHALYKKLASQPEPIGGDPKWNFTKFVVDREGRVVARFEPKIKPDDPALLKKLDELLAPAGGPKAGG